MVMVKSFDKYHHLFQPSHFGYYFVFFMIEIQAHWIKRYFNLTKKIFTKKDIVQE